MSVIGTYRNLFHSMLICLSFLIKNTYDLPYVAPPANPLYSFQTPENGKGVYMKRSLIFISIFVTLAACSQQSVERASYKTGRAAAAVAEGAERVYEKTVDTSVSAYEHVKDGYKERRYEEEKRRYEPYNDNNEPYY